MSCISWNCCGIGNPQTVDKLVTLVSRKDPKMVFLMETKVDREVIEKVRWKIQFAHMFVVPCPNQGGGLALLWKEDIMVGVQTLLDSHIDAVVDQGMNDAWRITGFYGNPDSTSWEDSWSLLRDLSHCFSLPQVCIGDFNEILKAEEKQGWLDRPQGQMQGFLDALDYYGLRDIGYNGFPFTWCNRRPGHHNIWVRLDREVASAD